MLDLKKMLTKISKQFSCESFTGTKSNAITRGDLLGTYDKTTGKVSITFHFYNSSDVQSSQSLFEIPQKYRPSATKTGAAVYVTNAPSTAPYICSVNANGNVYQTLGNTIRSGFGVIEYIISGGGVLLKWLKGSILNAFSHRRKAVASC